MKITVNAKPHETSAQALGAVLQELGFAGKAIATAVNGQFIPRDARDGTVLKDGDQLEVLAPMQGG